MEDKKNFYDYQIDFLNKKCTKLIVENEALLNEIAKLQKEIFALDNEEIKEKEGE
ncbi:hypothetical protein [Mycoplasmopsis arginini]|uniref:hypothetical protein n=1 Tax=Mycoplasmopsis arginini TaxID=2094 RepID=UPI000A27E870|nr:Uncharacterised protein [Mycoplasmopsis arginini]SGA33590.1 Uncharacterised protein [Chlamydia abortus]